MPTHSNLVWQFLGHGVSKGFIFLFYILLPLSIGIEEYGQFSFALAISFIVIQPTLELGLDLVVAKWVSRGRSEVFKKAFLLRMTAAALAAILSLTLPFFISVDSLLLLLMFAYLLLSSLQNLLFALYRGLEDMRRESLILPLEKCSAVILLLLLPLFGIRHASLGAAALLLSVFFGGSILVLSSKHDVARALSAPPHPSGPQASTLLREGLALGAVTFLWLVYFRIDSVMLGVMRGDFEVGIYNVAYKILEGLLFIPSTIMIVFFPKLAKREQFDETFGQLLLLLGALGLAISTFLYLASASLIRIIFGPQFSASAPVLQTLALVLLPVFFGHLTTQSLVALDLSQRYLIVASLGALLNVLLNLLLIPSLGAVGAAWATVGTEAFVTLLCVYFLWKVRPQVLHISSHAAAVHDAIVLLKRKGNP